jgi:hypothetical protein
MPSATRDLIQAHWTLANERRWEEFRTLLHPELHYEMPQTREYADSGEGYLELFRTWPGNWRATIQHLVCEENKAVSIIEFKVDAQLMTGISIFGVVEGRIISVTDYWPEPYEPPPRATAFLKRRASEA